VFPVDGGSAAALVAVASDRMEAGHDPPRDLRGQPLRWSPVEEHTDPGTA